MELAITYKRFSSPAQASQAVLHAYDLLPAQEAFAALPQSAGSSGRNGS